MNIWFDGFVRIYDCGFWSRAGVFPGWMDGMDDLDDSDARCYLLILHYLIRYKAEFI